MSMRSQVYEWDSSRGTAMTVATSLGTKVSIFVGGVGNNITKPAETTATEFVVIEDVSCTPSLGVHAGIVAATTVRGLLCADATSGGPLGYCGPRAYLQVRINTTDYFLDPDNIPNDGIPGAGSPYPRSINFQPAFNLYPDVYVLPGQVWDALMTFYNIGAFTNTDGAATAGELMAFVKYTLYDGPDALIANKLLEMGISINPGNVDWYKRSLLQAQV